MKSLTQYLNESLNEALSPRDRAARKQTIENISAKLGLEVDEWGITSTGYRFFVHKMPFKDKCIIVNYEDLTDRRTKGLIFVNALTDYQDKVWIIHDVPAFKQWIDDGLNGGVKYIWNSKPDEARLYGGNFNFFGVTVEVKELEKQPFCEVKNL